MDMAQTIAELMTLIDKPSVAERVVRPPDLKAVATAMARHGYEPTTTSLGALEKFMQGYNLWIDGDVGTGKTSFFTSMPRINMPDLHTEKIAVFDFGRIAGMEFDEVMTELEAHDRDELVLDDVGKEPRFNKYGERFELFPLIFERRLDLSVRTHVTTNFGPKYFDERYGYGLFDRLRAAAYHVTFKGVSKRTLKPHLKIRSGSAGG